MWDSCGLLETPCGFVWFSSLNPEFTAKTHINFKKIPHLSTKPRLTVLLIEALWERDLRWVSGISSLGVPEELLPARADSFVALRI
jgi:hypothetical protein